MTATSATISTPPAAGGHPCGEIGPNAVIRVAEALRAVEGAHQVARIFRASNLERYLDQPPEHMIDEREVAVLHREVRSQLGPARARTIGWVAGLRTADYLLDHRIPHAAQRVIRGLPGRQASWLLATAIRRNAWTFAGTGDFTVQHGRPTVFSIADCPLCRKQTSVAPYCDYYAGTFERLFRTLVHPGSRAVETECQATGGSACRFTIAW